MNTYSAEELATRDVQRDHIAQLMLSGEWKGGASRKGLAESWQMKLGDVYRLEGEAAGAIRLARKPGWEDYVESKLQELDELIALARSTIKVISIKGEPYEYGAPAIGAAATCIRTQLEIMGALKRPGDKVPAGKTDDGFDDMTAAQQAAMLRQAADELDGKRGPLQ